MTSRRSLRSRRRRTRPRSWSVAVTSVALALDQPSRRRSVLSSADPPAVVRTTSTEKPAGETPSRFSSAATLLRTAASARSNALSARCASGSPSSSAIAVGIYGRSRTPGRNRGDKGWPVPGRAPYLRALAGPAHVWRGHPAGGCLLLGPRHDHRLVDPA